MKLAGFCAVLLIWGVVSPSSAQSSNSFMRFGLELLKYLNNRSPVISGRMKFNPAKFMSEFMLRSLEDTTLLTNSRNTIENGVFRMLGLNSKSRQELMNEMGDIITKSLVKQYNEVKNLSDWSRISTDAKLTRVIAATLVDGDFYMRGQLLNSTKLSTLLKQNKLNVNVSDVLAYNISQTFEILQEAAEQGQEEFYVALYTVFNTTIPSNFITSKILTHSMITKSVNISSHYVYNVYLNLTRNVTGFKQMNGIMRAVMILQYIDWNIMMKDIDSVVTPKLKEYFTEPPIDDQCSRDLASFRSSLTFKNFANPYENWGWKMIDAMGKPGSDILEGGLDMPGSKIECDQIRGHRFMPDNSTKKWAFGTNYCISKWVIPKTAFPALPMGLTPSFSIGICLPESCRSKDLVALTKFTELLSINSSSAYCFDELPANTDAASHDPQYILAWCILGFFITLTVICSTIDRVHYIRLENSRLNSKNKNPEEEMELKPVSNGYGNGVSEKGLKVTEVNGNGGSHDVTEKSEMTCNGVHKSVENGTAHNDVEAKSEDKPKKRKLSCGYGIVKAFSVFNNMSFLLNTTERPGSLKGLNGIRFISMCWVMIGHVYAIQSFPAPMAIRNGLVGMRWIQDWQFQGIIAGVFAVDSFFVLSGLLVGYLFLKMMDKINGKLKCMHMVLYYVHRYLRLTPLMAAVIVIWVGFDRYVGRGPFTVWTGVEACDKGWWMPLLYVNNFVDKTQCMGWVWYLANDMQFYVVAPIFLIPLYKKKVVGFILIGIALVAHLAVTVWLYFDIGDPRSQMAGNQEITERIYDKPYARIGPYLIGLILAYLLFKKYRVNSKIGHAVLWLISIGLIAILVYIPWDDWKDTEMMMGTAGRWNLTQRAIFEGFNRTIWAVALGWIIFACNTNAAGVVGDILNWSGWAPLSKLTYSAYLIHPLLEMIDLFNISQPLHLSHYGQIKQFIIILFSSYSGGAVLHLLFEAPMAGIEKLILPSR